MCNQYRTSTALPRVGPVIDDEDESQHQAMAVLTLLDYFAATAMQAELSNGGAERHDEARTANWSYFMADAMLKERAK